MSHNIDDLLEEIEILKGYKHMYQKLNEQNKRYQEFIKTVSDNWLIAGKIKNEVEGIRIITPHHLFNWINKEANKLLEESK